MGKEGISMRVRKKEVRCESRDLSISSPGVLLLNPVRSAHGGFPLEPEGLEWLEVTLNKGSRTVSDFSEGLVHLGES